MRRDEVHVWKISLGPLRREKGRLAGLLSADERVRAERYAFVGDRDAFVIRRAALRMILGGYLGADAASVPFRCGRFGKPGLEGTDLSFNTSQSSGQVICALTRGRGIGADIERMKAIDSIELLAERFFAGPECELIRGSRPRERRRVFFDLWVRKEAVVKGIGGGLNIPLSGFDLSGLFRRPGLPVRVIDPQERESEWTVHGLEGLRGYAAALALEGPASRNLKIRVFAFSPGSERVRFG